MIMTNLGFGLKSSTSAEEAVVCPIL